MNDTKHHMDSHVLSAGDGQARGHYDSHELWRVAGVVTACVQEHLDGGTPTASNPDSRHVEVLQEQLRGLLMEVRSSFV